MFIKDCFKINDIKKIIMPKKGEYVKLKNYEIKIKRHQLKFRQILKIFQCQKVMENKIHKSLIQTNIKNILLAVMAINYYVDDKFSKSFKTY